MKKLPFTIESMTKAQESLNIALAQAMSLISANKAEEAKVSLTFSIGMKPDMDDGHSFIPDIRWKTSVQIPMKIENNGSLPEAAHVYWDQAEGGYVMELAGEQMKMEI